MTETNIGGQVQIGKNMADRSKYLERFSVSQSLNMPVSRQELWQVISRAGNLEDCHPFCRSNIAIKWGDDEKIDQLEYLNGLTYLRKFLSWDEHNGYELMIGNEIDKQSFVIWQIDELAEHQSRLIITVFPYLFSNWWRLPYYLIYRFYIKPRLASYLKSVLNGFHYNISLKKKVPRNNFGKHPWFS